MTPKRLSPLFTWRSAIAESDLRPTLRHVALTLSLHMSELGDSAYPSVATMARETGHSQSTVRASLRALEEQGYLQVKEREGRNFTNLYIACVPNETPPGAGGSTSEADPTPPTTGESPHRELVGAATDTPPGNSTDPTGSRWETHRETAPTPPGAGDKDVLKATFKRQEDVKLMSPPPEDDARVSFERFWNLYPRRNGKRLKQDKALDQWRRLKPDEREIAIVAVTNYSNACEARLTIAADAFRWLRDAAWGDWLTPAEPAQTSNGNGHRPFENPSDEEYAAADRVQ